jgi:hypothetical protein
VGGGGSFAAPDFPFLVLCLSTRKQSDQAELVSTGVKTAVAQLPRRVRQNHKGPMLVRIDPLWLVAARKTSRLRQTN